MGKPTGFLEYQREEAKHRPPRQRVEDFDEFLSPHDADLLHTQSARCMDCGVPFCHTGMVVEGLSIGCPLKNLIPEMNDLLYRGQSAQAYARLSMTNPFPEFTGRVCPALCEGSCTLGEHEPAVTIKNIECYIADYALEHSLLQPRIPEKRSGRRVAVIGSGPAGLACADMLNQLGNTVTVFERADRAGGLLMYGIPNMKLDKKLVQFRVRLLEQEGVEFRLNTDVGADYPAMELLVEFDGVVLCAGSRQQRLLTVPGADLDGVITSMDYLTASTRHLLDGNDAISARGKEVIVVGGGDTGTDCVATALRQGAASVTQLEIIPRLPEQRSPDNPWPLWPKISKTDYGQQEAIELFGKDPREYETTVKEVVGKDGRVTGVRTVKVQWADEGGMMIPRDIPGTEQLRPADVVLTAMGFTGPESGLIQQLGLQADVRGNVATKTESYASSLKSVFAAGDMRRGPSLVVWAILEGRRAAMECDAHLRGK